MPIVPYLLSNILSVNKNVSHRFSYIVQCIVTNGSFANFWCIKTPLVFNDFDLMILWSVLSPLISRIGQMFTVFFEYFCEISSRNRKMPDSTSTIWTSRGRFVGGKIDRATLTYDIMNFRNCSARLVVLAKTNHAFYELSTRIDNISVLWKYCSIFKTIRI